MQYVAFFTDSSTDVGPNKENKRLVQHLGNNFSSRFLMFILLLPRREELDRSQKNEKRNDEEGLNKSL
jgi:hypothetical protein